MLTWLAETTSRFWEWIAYLWKTPSAFQDNWLKYAKNQLAHGLVIGFLPALFLSPSAIGILLVCYALWEYSQWQFRRAEASDCWEDWAFVASGAFAGMTGSLGYIVIMIAVLVAGIFWRVERHGA